jgi:hypothetical protein
VVTVQAGEFGAKTSSPVQSSSVQLYAVRQRWNIQQLQLVGLCISPFGNFANRKAKDMLATHSIVWNGSNGSWLMAYGLWLIDRLIPLRLSAVWSGLQTGNLPSLLPIIPSLVVRKRITPTDFYSYLRIFIQLRRSPRADVSRGFLILRTSNIQHLPRIDIVCAIIGSICVARPPIPTARRTDSTQYTAYLLVCSSARRFCFYFCLLPNTLLLPTPSL